MRLTGSQILPALLERHGVTTIARIPCGVEGVLCTTRAGRTIRHGFSRHDMALDLSRRAWRAPPAVPPVCLGTSGPGATNLLTAIADGNWIRSCPMASTGQGRVT